jgi:hypothetical protein
MNLFINQTCLPSGTQRARFHDKKRQKKREIYTHMTFGNISYEEWKKYDTHSNKVSSVWTFQTH